MPGKTATIIDHVGNVFCHGFPDDDREWSLKPKRVKTNTIAVKSCPDCYGTHFPCMVCPYCGHEYSTDEHTPYEIEILKEEELQRITEIKRKEKIEVWKCKTFEDLKEIEKSRGYEKGWAYLQAKIRKIPVRG